MDLNLDTLNEEERRALADLWDAPSAAPTALERFLSAPLQIRRRIDALSAQGREELGALLEATCASVPFDALRQVAVEELAQLMLVRISTQEPLRVTMPDEVAMAALEVLEPTPCRLRLLLHGLAREQLASMLAAHMGKPISHESPRLPQRLYSLLTDRQHLQGLISRLPPRSVDTLWDLVANGGIASLDVAQKARPGGMEHLLRLGLVWLTALDARISVEVLRALLLLRLGRQVHRATARSAALVRSAPRDNVRPFPSDKERWLGHTAEKLGRMDRSTPLDPQQWPELLETSERDELQKRLRLSMTAQLIERRGQRHHVGTLAHGGQWTRVPTQNLGDMVLQRLVERVTWGEPWSGTSEATASLFGSDAGEEPLSFDATDDDTVACICAVAPHLMDPDEALHTLTGARVGAQRLLRALLQQLLASLKPGQLVALSELDGVVESLVAVAHRHLRLVGCLYARDPREPQPERRRQALKSYLEAAALPLGWLRTQGPIQPEPAPVGTLPLFGHLSPAHSAPPTQEGPQELRVCLRPPSVSPEIAGLTHLPQDHLRLLQPFWGSTSKAKPPAEEGVELTTASLREQLRAFAQSAQPQDTEVVDLFRDFVLGQTAARRLQEIQPDDMTRFLVCWIRMDVPAGSLTRVRQIFAGLEHLSKWSQHQDIALQMDFEHLRTNLEGRLLRTCSAEAAFGSLQGTAPPPDLLIERPEQAHDGLTEVLRLSPGQRTVTLKAFGSDDSGDTWEVRTAPEPLYLLKAGDLLDCRLVRYGRYCWLERLRRVLIGESSAYLRGRT